jgi:chromosomal replication initiation ATPase DnaA
MKKFTEDELAKIDLVEKVLCKEFNISENDFASKNSTANVSLARGFLFYFLHKEYNLSAGKLSKYYFRGARAIFWNVSKIGFLIKQRAYKEIYEKVCRELGK